MQNEHVRHIMTEEVLSIDIRESICEAMRRRGITHGDKRCPFVARGRRKQPSHRNCHNY